MNNVEKNSLRAVTVFLISIVSMFGFLYHIYSGDVSSYSGWIKWIYDSNIKIYALALMVFGTLYIVIHFVWILFQKKLNQNVKVLRYFSLKVQYIITGIISVIGCGLYLHYEFVGKFRDPEMDMEIGMFKNYPFAIIVIFGMLIISRVICMHIKKTDISRETLIMVYIISIILSFLYFYVPNQFTTQTDLSVAFVCNFSRFTQIRETIYNAVEGTPYTIDTSSLYGHYGIFFVLPMKILGSTNPYACSILMGGVAAITQVATLYVIHLFYKKRWISAILAMAAVIRQSSYVEAIPPIRTFFPMLMFAYLVWLNKNGKSAWNRYAIMGYLLGTMAMVWNFETGLGCVTGYSVYAVFELLQDERYSKRKKAIKICIAILLLPICIVGAIIVVNIYNIICGGPLIFRSFFYPIINFGGSSYMVSYCRLNVQLGNQAWMHILFFLLAILCWGAFHSQVFNKETEAFKEAPLFGGVATIGIAAFSYYMNEAGWNCIQIIWQLLVGLAAVVISILYPTLENSVKNGNIILILKRSACIYLIFVALIFSLYTVNDPICLAAREKHGAYNLEQYLADIETLRISIPENTYGVGQGIAQIYHDLGWDNRAKYRDTSAIYMSSKGSRDKLIAEIIEQDGFLMEASSGYDIVILEDVLKCDETFKEIASVEICGYIFKYYSRD